MQAALIAYLPWLLSVITICSMVLAGSKKRSAWSLGLLNQALWLIWICADSAWGLLPMNIALWFVFGRNYWKWNQ